MKRPSVKKYNLVVVAHPDDETIFFGGLLQAYRRRPWKVICATDGNADGMGVQRRQDFQRACDALKVQNCEMWDFPDRFENRLDIDRLAERLKQETASEIFTHGVLGEYGHPHPRRLSSGSPRVLAQTQGVERGLQLFRRKSFSSAPQRFRPQERSAVANLFFGNPKIRALASRHQLRRFRARGSQRDRSSLRIFRARRKTARDAAESLLLV